MDFAAKLVIADRTARDHLGGLVTYTPGAGAAVQVQGIFDALYQRVDAGQPGVSSSGPAVFLTLADLPSNPVTDTAATVTVDGTTYTQAEAMPDGQGGVLIRLHEA